MWSGWYKKVQCMRFDSVCCKRWNMMLVIVFHEIFENCHCSCQCIIIRSVYLILPWKIPRTDRPSMQSNKNENEDKTKNKVKKSKRSMMMPWHVRNMIPKFVWFYWVIFFSLSVQMQSRPTHSDIIGNWPHIVIGFICEHTYKPI